MCVGVSIEVRKEKEGRGKLGPGFEFAPLYCHGGVGVVWPLFLAGLLSWSIVWVSDRFSKSYQVPGIRDSMTVYNKIMKLKNKTAVRWRNWLRSNIFKLCVILRSHVLRV